MHKLFSCIRSSTYSLPPKDKGHSSPIKIRHLQTSKAHITFADPFQERPKTPLLAYFSLFFAGNQFPQYRFRPLFWAPVTPRKVTTKVQIDSHINKDAPSTGNELPQELIRLPLSSHLVTTFPNLVTRILRRRVPFRTQKGALWFLVTLFRNLVSFERSNGESPSKLVFDTLPFPIRDHMPKLGILTLSGAPIQDPFLSKMDSFILTRGSLKPLSRGNKNPKPSWPHTGPKHGPDGQSPISLPNPPSHEASAPCSTGSFIPRPPGSAGSRPHGSNHHPTPAGRASNVDTFQAPTQAELPASANVDTLAANTQPKAPNVDTFRSPACSVPQAANVDTFSDPIARAISPLKTLLFLQAKFSFSESKTFRVLASLYLFHGAYS